MIDDGTLSGTFFDDKTIVFEPITVYNDDEIDLVNEIGKATGDLHDVGTVTDDGKMTNYVDLTETITDETIE
jgi:tRNA A-37 threonylcarbamoyl transferase component Bud32